MTEETGETELIAHLISLPCPFDTPLKFEPTAFELMLERLGLSEESCTDSEEVRDWCKAHKNHRFVPESVLQHFNLRVSHTNF